MGSNSLKHPRVFVGTCGWLYDWNAEGTLDWYISFSGLNAVELNSSFYRFPFPNQVRAWARKSRKLLRWSVKVHRSITHVRKLREESHETWKRFRRLFRPLESQIDFYLLQLPPSFRMGKESVRRLKLFAEITGLGEKLAVEFRHESWFTDEALSIVKDVGATIVSFDSPIGTRIWTTNGIVYLRLHGREEWYAYEYTHEELKEIVEAIAKLSPQKVYVFFNNNHWMLENAKEMLRLLKEKLY